MAMIEGFNERLFARFLREVEEHAETGLKVGGANLWFDSDVDPERLTASPGHRHPEATLTQIVLCTKLPTLQEAMAQEMTLMPPAEEDTPWAKPQIYCQFREAAVKALAKSVGGEYWLWNLTFFNFSFTEKDVDDETWNVYLAPLFYRRTGGQASENIDVLTDLQFGDATNWAQRWSDCNIEDLFKKAHQPGPAIINAHKLWRKYGV